MNLALLRKGKQKFFAEKRKKNIAAAFIHYFILLLNFYLSINLGVMLRNQWERETLMVSFFFSKLFLGNLNKATLLVEIIVTLKVASISANGISSFRFSREIIRKRKLCLSQAWKMWNCCYAIYLLLSDIVKGKYAYNPSKLTESLLW